MKTWRVAFPRQSPSDHAPSLQEEERHQIASQGKEETTLPAKLISPSPGSGSVKWKWTGSSEPALISLLRSVLDTDEPS